MNEKFFKGFAVIQTILTAFILVTLVLCLKPITQIQTSMYENELEKLSTAKSKPVDSYTWEISVPNVSAKTLEDIFIMWTIHYNYETITTNDGFKVHIKIPKLHYDYKDAFKFKNGKVIISTFLENDGFSCLEFERYIKNYSK